MQAVRKKGGTDRGMEQGQTGKVINMKTGKCLQHRKYQEEDEKENKIES